MAFGSTALLLYEAAAIFARESLSFLQDYVPMFARYGAIFSAKGRAADFLPFVSVYLFYLSLQGVVVIGLILCLVGSYVSTPNSRPQRFGFWKNIVFLMMFLFFAIPMADLFFGISNIENPGLFENGLLYGNYFTAVYMDCLILPMFNAFLYLLLLARLIDIDLTPRAELEPEKNPDRVWKIDSMGRDVE